MLIIQMLIIHIAESIVQHKQFTVGSEIKIDIKFIFSKKKTTFVTTNVKSFVFLKKEPIILSARLCASVTKYSKYLNHQATAVTCK